MKALIDQLITLIIELILAKLRGPKGPLSSPPSSTLPLSLSLSPTTL